ncbi:MAG: zinc-finger domain-containing protein [Sphingomonadales bacterium]|nr:zinc-finger domain-containing protein [Sphingomonadales bacterium]
MLISCPERIALILSPATPDRRLRLWKSRHGPAITRGVTEPPETVVALAHRVCCDGASAIRSTGAWRPAALGHPRVWLEIDGKGFVDCPYCDRRFVYEGAAAH